MKRCIAWLIKAKNDYDCVFYLIRFGLILKTAINVL